MTRPNAVILASAFALLFAVLAGWMSYRYLQSEMSSMKAVQPQKIVVAAADIPIGTTINKSQLRVVSWPKDSIPQGSSQRPEQLVNRVAIRPITSGDAVTGTKLKPREGTPGSGFMTYVVPQGHRAVTVAVNEVAGVAGFLTPSDRVDVIVTTPVPDNEKQSVSKIMLENVPVLATGQVTDQKEGKPVVVPTVTLDLLPEDAEKIVLSSSKGSLQLLLRNISDSARVETGGATIAKVLSGIERIPPPKGVTVTAPVRLARTAFKPAPAVKASAPSYTLEIIRGTEKSSRQYAE